MGSNSKRIAKVNDLIRDELGVVLRHELDFADDVLVTVIRVDTSPTMEHATVFISVIPDKRSSAVMRHIKRDIYNIQQELNKKIVVRPVPKIRFEVDTSGDHIQRIEKLLENQ
ncbi:MAG: 30S ribosome-binding factor RbfA [Parcubacteria group bacterium]